MAAVERGMDPYKKKKKKKEKGNKTFHPAEGLLRQNEINALLKIILLLIIC